MKKAELHLHLEGAAPPHLVKQLGQRNGIDLPDKLFVNDDVFAWSDFIHFLDVYEQASQVIQKPRDYYDITYYYLKQCALEGAIYVEMMYSPDHAEKASGIPSCEHLKAIDDAIDHARRDYGIEGRTIITCVRHYGVESCMKVAKQAAKENSPYIVGFGMGGDEVGFPAGQFATVFAEAHASGLPCTVHAGEFDGPSGIRQALELPIQRIGHGVRSVEDPELVQQIIDAGIVFEVCPNSNMANKLYPSYAQHPLHELLAKGAKVTLNSDDPPYWNTTIGKEYETAKTEFGFSDDVILQFTRTAIESSFADNDTKKRLLDSLANG